MTALRLGKAEYLEMTVEHGLCRSMVNLDVYIECEPLEVKVPLIFSGTVGFPQGRTLYYYL